MHHPMVHCGLLTIHREKKPTEKEQSFRYRKISAVKNLLRRACQKKGNLSVGSVLQGDKSEQQVIRSALLSSLRKTLDELPTFDRTIISRRYLAQPRTTLQRLSEELHILVMTLWHRENRILKALKRKICNDMVEK